MSIPVICSPCPLSSKIPSLRNPIALQCKEIIEDARHIWGYLSPKEQSVYYEIVDDKEVPKKFPPYSTLKLTSARSIQSWYGKSDLRLINKFQFKSKEYAEPIKDAVNDARRYARPSIEKEIPYQAILAIFAICEAFEALNDMSHGKPKDDPCIKEKVYGASVFLSLAKSKEEKSLSGDKWTDLIITVCDNETVKTTLCGKTGTPQKFVELGFKDKRTGKPVKSWQILLAFAEKERLTFPQTQKEKMEKLIKDLRKRLKAHYKIPGDPIVFENGYKPVFEIQKYEGQSRSVHAFSNSDHLNETDND
ncbi:MAG TPA: hypothetical protein ACFYEK_04315 [Candidatus Wunengus sp. YC60]|uniref:hypothetical protein n=1 Tax=Candidatus Wunengus sp. YC60 TaxID=3367697 RepID=UPI004028E9DE